MSRAVFRWATQIAVWTWATVSVAVPEPDARVARAAVDLRESRSVRQAERTLVRLSRDRDEEVRADASAVLSAHYRRTGRLDQAGPLVADWADLRPENLVGGRLEALLEHARCEAEGGQPMAAFRILDYARDRTRHLAAASTRIAYADVVEMAQAYQRALAWLEEALPHGDEWVRQRRMAAEEAGQPASSTDTERWDSLRREIVERIEDLRYKARAERWGPEFALYWTAQEARRSSHPLATDFTDLSQPYSGAAHSRARVPGADVERALQLYDQLIEEAPGTVFAEAAELYRAVCLMHLGRAAEAERALTDFIGRSPMGLYRGEAQVLLGDIRWQAQWDARGAREAFTQALDWCERAEAIREGARLYAVPDRTRSISAAPRDWQRFIPGGVIVRETIPEQAVVNRLTAPWYLDRLQADLFLRLGFLSALEGDWAAALDDWRRVASHDRLLAEAQDRRYFNTLFRLEGIAEKGRYLLGHADENARIPDRIRPVLWWADFLHLCEEFERAESLYRRLYENAVARRDGAIAARAGLGLMMRFSGEAVRSTGENRASLASRSRALGEEILSRFPRAPASPYVAFMMAYSAPTGTSEGKAAAQAAYTRVHTRYPQSRFAEEARFRAILSTLGPGTVEESLPAIEAFRRDHPDSAWTRLLDSEVAFIRRYRAQYGKGEGKRPEPKQNEKENEP